MWVKASGSREKRKDNNQYQYIQGKLSGGHMSSHCGNRKEEDNTMPNTSETSRKVPNDCVKVVMMMALPDCRSLYHTSSVPIIRLTEYFQICTMVWYHCASGICWLIRQSACGPKNMPVINHPSMAGNLILDMSCPIKKEIPTAILFAEIKRFFYFTACADLLGFACDAVKNTLSDFALLCIIKKVK